MAKMIRALGAPGERAALSVQEDARVVVFLRGLPNGQPKRIEYTSPINAENVAQRAHGSVTVMTAREWRVWFPAAMAIVPAPREKNDGGAPWVWLLATQEGETDRELAMSIEEAIERIRSIVSGGSVCLVGTPAGYVLAVNRIAQIVAIGDEAGAPVFTAEQSAAVRLAYGVAPTQEGAVGAVLRELATVAALTAEEHRQIAQTCQDWATFR